MALASPPKMPTFPLLPLTGEPEKPRHERLIDDIGAVSGIAWLGLLTVAIVWIGALSVLHHGFNAAFEAFLSRFISQGGWAAFLLPLPPIALRFLRKLRYREIRAGTSPIR